MELVEIQVGQVWQSTIVVDILTAPGPPLAPGDKILIAAEDKTWLKTGLYEERWICQPLNGEPFVVAGQWIRKYFTLPE
jgi:hypothetical protein